MFALYQLGLLLPLPSQLGAVGADSTSQLWFPLGSAPRLEQEQERDDWAQIMAREGAAEIPRERGFTFFQSQAGKLEGLGWGSFKDPEMLLTY